MLHNTLQPLNIHLLHCTLRGDRLDLTCTVHDVLRTKS